MGCESTILLNGGFEAWTDGIPDNWGSGGTQEQVIVHGGVSSVVLSNNNLAVQNIGALSEICYTLDFWYNAPEGTIPMFVFGKQLGEDSFALQLDGTWQKTEGVLLPVTNGWENTQINFNGEVGWTYIIMLTNSNESNVYLDDVCLYPCDDEPVGDDALSATCGQSLFKLDILRQRIRTDGTNYYLVVG